MKEDEYQNVRIQILDIQGRLIKSVFVMANEWIPLNLKSGVYFLNCNGATKKNCNYTLSLFALANDF